MPATNKRQLAIRRLIALCLTPLLVVFAVTSTIDARGSSGHFAQWQTDRPVDAFVDFSKTGLTTMPFTQTCQIAHAEFVSLELEDAAALMPDPLSGLAGSMNIVYGDDTVVASSDLASAAFYDDGTNRRRFVLARFAPISNGTYTLKLQVDKPAPLLANHRQRLSAQYMLCGMEKLPELLASSFAILGWILVLAVGVPSLIGWLRYGWRVKP
jgi:hypothetical protein